MSAFWDRKKLSSPAEQEDDFEAIDDSLLHLVAGGTSDEPQYSGEPCWICESTNTYLEYIDGLLYLVCHDCPHKSLAVDGIFIS